MGGENLIEKAELQEKLIAESEAELQLRRNKEKELQKTLEQRQAEILKIEDSYGTLQEEVNALNKKLKKVRKFRASLRNKFQFHYYFEGFQLLERRKK